MRLSIQMQWLPFLAVSVLLGLIGRRCCDGASCPAGFVNITDREASFSSPNQGGNYGINETCKWMIKYDTNKYRTRITFNSFEIEECKSCDCDSVQRSSNSNFQSATKMCGRFTENYLNSEDGDDITVSTSSSPYYVQFVSDGSFGFPGFQASVIAESLESYDHTSYLNASGDETLHFSTPKYPAKYPSGWRYQWRLIVEVGRQVQLNCDEFELENSPNCDNDWFEVRETNRRGTFMGGPYCGSTKPASIQSKSNVLWVQFRSDSNDTTTYKGFKCNFHATGSDGTLLVGSVVFSFLLPFLVLTALNHN